MAPSGTPQQGAYFFVPLRLLMATQNFTSGPFQSEAVLPGYGKVNSVTVAGAPWSWRQDGEGDLTVSFAPALPGGLAVVIDYTPVAAPAVASVTVANNLVTDSATQVLSAAQGVVLKGLIDALQAALNAGLAGPALVATINATLGGTGWQGAGGGGGSGVSSFNGRTGAVSPQTNDYSFSQLSGKPTTLAGYGITDAAASSHTHTPSEVGLGNVLNVEQAPKLMTVQAAKTTAYTLQASDARTVIPVNSGSAVTITVPTGLPAGFSVVLVQRGAGAVSLAGTATRLGASATANANDVLTLTPVGADTYVCKVG